MFLRGLFKILYENQVLVVDALLKSLKIKVSIPTIDQTLQEHPDYPSFLSIVDSLSKWNVQSIAIQTTADKLPEIPTPFITTKTLDYRKNFCLTSEFSKTVINYERTAESAISYIYLAMMCLIVKILFNSNSLLENKYYSIMLV